MQIVLDEATFMLPLAGVIDVAREQARLQKEIEKAGSEISKWTAKLGNEAFVAKAPPEVIEEQRERLAEATAPGPNWPRRWSGSPRCSRVRIRSFAKARARRQ